MVLTPDVIRTRLIPFQKRQKLQQNIDQLSQRLAPLIRESPIGTTIHQEYIEILAVLDAMKLHLSPGRIL